MPREFIADSYGEIRKRMEELKPQQPQAEQPVPTEYNAPRQLPNLRPSKMLAAERQLVAELLNCRWRQLGASGGCGKEATWDCVRNKRCMTGNPAP